MDDLKRVEDEIITAVVRCQHSLQYGRNGSNTPFIQRNQRKYTRLDILVNNAATNPFFGDVLSADEKPGKLCRQHERCLFITQEAAK